MAHPNAELVRGGCEAFAEVADGKAEQCRTIRVDAYAEDELWS